MALTNENGMVMPVSPMYGNGGGGMFGGWDSSAWLILIVLFALGGWGGFGGYGGGAADGSILYPWMNQSEVTTSGFQNLSTQNQITAVQSDLGDIQTQLCNGFAGVNATVNGGFANAESSANARQIANMQTAFNSQTAIVGAITDLASQQANSCFENRLATCQTQNIIQNEGNQTRFADANNTRDLLQNQTANTQAILDKLCQLELDAKDTKINDLERQLTMANLAASQTAQNSFIQKGFSDEVDALYNRLSNCPVPTTPVYGRTPIFSCNNNGCGCGSF